MLRAETSPTSLHCLSGAKLDDSRPPEPSVHTWLRHWISTLGLAEGLGLAGGPVGPARSITAYSGTQLFPSG